ncbi:MAG TPA: 50S ribosomal protein L10 [Chlamydiales bacterium]|nr:50S ribosomal protein L10 [Chlamydiales bacterium]
MRKEKELLLNEIKEKIDASQSMVVASYAQLTPNLSWQLRDAVAKAGGHFEVVRKTVFAKAAEKVGIAFEMEQLKGHIGILFVNQSDVIPSTKALYQFSEANGKLVEMLFGQIDGKKTIAADLALLATLPGLDEMRANFLGLITAPMSQMLSVMEAAIVKNESVGE